MGKIHYFQRYSSIENTVTNNTLQLISLIYQNSPTKASQLLTDLTGQSIDIGLDIVQQQREGHSVPDATIMQRSFKVLLEAKVDSPVCTEQLLRHAKGFKNEEIQILLLLTKTALTQEQSNQIKEEIKQDHPSVVFQHITYEDICNICSELFQSHEYKINDLIRDYQEYCNDSGLFDQARHTMRVVPCGTSVLLNLKYEMYFQPSDRGYSNHRYLGIYKDKRVQAIWEIDHIIDVEVTDGKVKTVFVSGEPTDKYDEKILNMISEAKNECGYDIHTGHRFFCGNSYSTNFIKESSGGIMNARLFNLKEYSNDWDNPASLAMALKDQSWKE
ncbi:hypothetical protein [Motilimonas pumila]|uniref:Uncharacterized protein n=1 Tax=Motilimonas pumila TaxID=2303987 RepID=A0A418YA19_9GAMM|nr:hypothetical protein [Motilimonas pumila]RJG38779.1 hypothetical protein D1Z90_18720 [Motilimonas pumila]